jgi:hypothetical protein
MLSVAEEINLLLKETTQATSEAKKCQQLEIELREDTRQWN